MKTMNFMQFGKRAISFSLLLAIFSAYSMVTLAASTPPVGELIVTRSNSDAAVTVNGEPAVSGRTVFAGSTITTPDGVTASLNLGKAGKLEISPNSTFAIDGEANALSGSLSAGSVSLAGSKIPFDVKTLSGETVTLNEGDTATASSARAARDHRDSAGNCVDDDNDGKKECGLAAIPPWGWAAIIGGAALVVILVATSGDDSPSSPVR